MTEDLIPGWDDTDDVDPSNVPVPGSRPRVDHQKRETVTLPKTEWDRNPRSYMVNGSLRTDLFPVSALQSATGLKYSTLRKWEKEGIFPEAWLRGPLTARARERGLKGHRLYSRAFIEGVVKLIEEEGVKHTHRNIHMTNFSKRVHELFKETGG